MLGFLGIGAQKAGTSWLYAQLCQHPQLGFPLGKEAHFWNRAPTPEGIAAYLARFADPLRIEGEITPAYAALPLEVIRQIHRAAPDLRLIYILRNPVERAWSSAQMALARAEMTPAEASQRWYLDHFRSAGSRARGDYAGAIARWRQVFGAQALLIVRYEQIESQPQAVLAQVCAHLGVSAPTEAMLQGCGQRVFAGNGAPLPAPLRRALEAMYRPQVRALAQLLNMDLSEWMKDSKPFEPPQRQKSALPVRIVQRLRERRACRQLRRSGLFDARFYLAHNPDVAAAGMDPLLHFLRFGGAEQRAPSAAFDSAAYCSAYPDVAAAGLNPLLHYLTFGRGEGRRYVALGAAADHKKQAPATAAQAAAEASSVVTVPPAATKKALVSKRPVFADFTDYERQSMFLSPIRAPLDEQDKYVLGHMHTVRQHLARQAQPAADAPWVSLVLLGSGTPAQWRRTLASVQAQSWPRVQVLLPAAAQIEALGESVEWITLPAEINNAAALDAALALARGEWVGYVRAGDVLDADFVAILAAALNAQAGCELAYCAQAQHAADDTLQALHYSVACTPLLENQPVVDGTAILHRRALVDAVAGFDATLELPLAQWDFILKAAERAALVSVPCVLSTRYGAPALPDNVPDMAARRAPRLIDLLPDVPSVPGLDRLHGLPHPLLTVSPALAARKVAVIIPSFECLDYLRLCVASVQTFTPPGHQLIVVDNASGADVRAYLAELSRQPNVTVIQNEHNYGFTYAVNQGIECADAQADVILLNNDALVTPGWLQAMQQVLDDCPDAGLVLPRQVLPAHTQTIQIHNPAMNPAREAEVNLSLHHNNVLEPLLDVQRGYVGLRFAPFFCVYIPRRTLNEVGLLDYARAPHYDSDNLYCEAVRRIAGRRIVYTPHAKLYHFLQRATTQLKQADPRMFQSMFVKNEWKEIQRRSHA